MYHVLKHVYCHTDISHTYNPIPVPSSSSTSKSWKHALMVRKSLIDIKSSEFLTLRGEPIEQSLGRTTAEWVDQRPHYCLLPLVNWSSPRSTASFYSHALLNSSDFSCLLIFLPCLYHEHKSSCRSETKMQQTPFNRGKQRRKKLGDYSQCSIPDLPTSSLQSCARLHTSGRESARNRLGSYVLISGSLYLFLSKQLPQTIAVPLTAC